MLERKGWIAEALCREVRVPMDAELRKRYVLADQRAQFRLGAENPAKMEVLEELLAAHRGDLVLVIGTYLSQLKQLAKDLDAPLITGSTPHKIRERLFKRFRTGELKVLIVSKVANFAIDLPDANVAIQVSGSFGSRQEEAQRLGRILRPKEKDAFFYTVVTSDTKEQEFAIKRQLFLTEQGYRYHIEEFAERR